MGITASRYYPALADPTESRFNVADMDTDVVVVKDLTPFEAMKCSDSLNQEQHPFSWKKDSVFKNTGSLD